MRWLASSKTPLLVTKGTLPPTVAQQVRAQVREAAGVTLTFVPHDWTHYQTLRAHAHEVPSLEPWYTYTGRFAPMEHQRRTVRFLLDHPKCYVLNGLGTGKTACALWSADYLMKMGVIKRVLIVTPKTTMHPVWAAEIFNLLPHRRALILKGSAERKRLDVRDPRYDFVIINPDSLHLLPAEMDCELIIVDEATAFKTWGSRRTKALNALSGPRRMWLMTATPASQNPTDAYALIRLVRKQFMSAAAFRGQVMTQVSQFKWVPKPEAANIVASYLTPAIRINREDCLDLPPCQYIDLPVDMTPAQGKAVKSFLREACAELQGQTVTAANAASAMSKALQVMAGGVYGSADGDGTPAYTVDSTPLFETIERLINEADGPVIVFVPFRVSVAVLHAYLLSKGIEMHVVTGAQTAEQRTAAFAAVQEKRTRGIIAIASTMSHGVTLTASDTIIWVSPPFSLETYIQANGRINRQGQVRKTIIYRLIQNSLAKTLFARLDGKATIQDAILKLKEEASE